MGLRTDPRLLGARGVTSVLHFVREAEPHHLEHPQCCTLSGEAQCLAGAGHPLSGALPVPSLSGFPSCPMQLPGEAAQRPGVTPA